MHKIMMEIMAKQAETVMFLLTWNSIITVVNSPSPDEKCKILLFHVYYFHPWCCLCQRSQIQEDPSPYWTKIQKHIYLCHGSSLDAFLRYLKFWMNLVSNLFQYCILLIGRHKASPRSHLKWSWEQLNQNIDIIVFPDDATNARFVPSHYFLVQTSLARIFLA